MWAATSRGLARLVGGSWEAIDTAAGYPGGYTEPVLVDRSGSVWAVAEDGIYVLPRGAAHFEKREPTRAGRSDGELELVAARTAPSGPSTGRTACSPWPTAAEDHRHPARSLTPIPASTP